MADANTPTSINLDDLDNRPDLIIPKKPYVVGHVKSISFVTRVNREKNDYDAIAVQIIENGTNAEAEMLFQTPKKLSECLGEKETKTVIWKLSQLKHLFGVFAKEEIKGLVWDDDTTYKMLYDKFVTFLPPVEEFSKIVCKFKIVANDSNLPQFPLFPPFISTKEKPREFKWTDKDPIEVSKTAQNESSNGASDDGAGW